MQIKVDPGGEKYVSLAKKWLKTLEQTRKDLRLPVMQQKRQIDADTQVQLVSADAGDRIRISAGTYIGFQRYFAARPHPVADFSILTTGAPRNTYPAGYTPIVSTTYRGFSVPYALGDQDQHCWAYAGTGKNSLSNLPDSGEQVLYVVGGEPVYTYTVGATEIVRDIGVDDEGGYILSQFEGGTFLLRGVRAPLVDGVRVVTLYEADTIDLVEPYLAATGLGVLNPDPELLPASQVEVTCEIYPSPLFTLITQGGFYHRTGGMGRVGLVTFYPTNIATYDISTVDYEGVYFEVTTERREVLFYLKSNATYGVIYDRISSAVSDMFYHDTDLLFALENATSLDGSGYDTEGYTESRVLLSGDRVIKLVLMDSFIAANLQDRQADGVKYYIETTHTKSGTNPPDFSGPTPYISSGGDFAGDAALVGGSLRYEIADVSISTPCTIPQVVPLPSPRSGVGFVVLAPRGAGAPDTIDSHVVSPYFSGKVVSSTVDSTANITLLADGRTSISLESTTDPETEETTTTTKVYQGSSVVRTLSCQFESYFVSQSGLSAYGTLTSYTADPKINNSYVVATVTQGEAGTNLSFTKAVNPKATTTKPDAEGNPVEWERVSTTVDAGEGFGLYTPYGTTDAIRSAET